MNSTAPSAGLGLRPEHYEAALGQTADGLWFEVHPENYMADGAALAWLRRFAERHPVALHGVALSLAADAPPDADHLERLRRLAEDVGAVRISEHLAWSVWRGAYYPDLLPFPRSSQALRRVCDNVASTQEALGRQIAIENPSHYVVIDGHDYDEIDFLEEIARRTGCGLLLDVNNVFISAHNLGFDAAAYLDRFPGKVVAEIHLAGFEPDEARDSPLWIDSHNTAIAEPVWALFERLIGRIGPRPTLIERDGNIPPFLELFAERVRAEAVLRLPLEQAA